ncbi:unnamed protein product [Amoebophrya sp. A120]|nr:unnamed protein product [Amoebophrya sp. A120]|eukprot:GSA120T00014187001.1
MDFLKQDVDRLLSYATKQEVKISDAKLGIANITFQILIVLYVVGFVFLYDEGYLEYEYAKGSTSVSVSKAGDVVVTSSGKPNSRSFSVEELTYPNLENGNLFVATKIETIDQKRETCEDRSKKCSGPEDVAKVCAKDVGAVTCSENGFCNEPGWCPSIDAGLTNEVETYKTPTAKLQVWIKSVVQFWNLNKERIFTNDLENIIVYPKEDANTFTVEDLLLLCQPPVRYEEISELGAAVEVLIKFPSCPVNSENCKPKISAKRVDSLFDQNAIGFEFTYKVPLATANERRLFKMKGVRFYFRTVGTGEEISVTSIIFKISTGIALLSLAPLLADLLMLKCFLKSKKYEARKYEYSQDLGDYFAELEKIHADAAARGVDPDAAEEDREGEDEEDILWRRRMEEED